MQTVAYPMRDEAFEDVIRLSHHILESSNAFHILSIRDFPGQSRVRFGILLTMFEELGKLLVLVQECEKAAKADYMSVRIDDFNDHELHGKRAVAQVLEELRTVELASASLIRDPRNARHLAPLNQCSPRWISVHSGIQCSTCP